MTIGSRGNIVDVTAFEPQLRKDKFKTKANFICARSNLLMLLEDRDMPSRREVKEACKKLDSCMEIVMTVISNMSDFYVRNGDLINGDQAVTEMEKIEKQYEAAHEAALDYLDSRKDDASSCLSNPASFDLVQRINLSRGQEETYETEDQGLSSEVMPSFLYDQYSPPVHMPNTTDSIKTNKHASHDRTNEIVGNWSRNSNGDHYADYQQEEAHVPTMNHADLGRQCSSNTFGERAAPQIDGAAYNYKPRSSMSESLSIGQDLWQQLKRIELPIFSGDKRTYQSWKAAFKACIDNAPATEEYKLLQLKQYLNGEALKAIENLGHSAVAYEAAKDRLERKYGGRRRQIAIYLEELEQFKQIRMGNSRDLEHFADLLDVAVINLKEAGQNHELGDGTLYTKLQQKLPETMLSRYHRWIFEKSLSESVQTLRTWVLQESEFQTVAAETVHGVAGITMDNQPAQKYTYRGHRTLFGNQIDSSGPEQTQCKVCGAQHDVCNCEEMLQMSFKERWNIAKQF